MFEVQRGCMGILASRLHGHKCGLRTERIPCHLLLTLLSGKSVRPCQSAVGSALSINGAHLCWNGR